MTEPMFVSYEFVSVDSGDTIDDLRTLLGVAEPTHLVITDRSSNGGTDDVYVIDVGRVTNLSRRGMPELVYAADLISDLGTSPAHVIDVDMHIARPVITPSSSGPFVLRVDDVVSAVATANTRIHVDLSHSGAARFAVAEDTLDFTDVWGEVSPQPDEAFADADAGEALADGDTHVPTNGRTDDEAVDRPQPGGDVDAAQAPAVNGLLVIAPSRVEYDTVVPLTVSLTRPGSDRPDMPFEAIAGEVITVVVWPLEGVTIDSNATAKIEVSESGDNSETIELHITSRRRAAVIVEAFKGQTSLGNVLVDLEVVIGQPSGSPSAQVISLRHGNAPDSDLALHIVEGPSPTGGRALRFVAIERGEPPVAFGFKDLDADPHSYLAPLFDSIDEAVDATGKGRVAPMTNADDVVRGIGLTLNDQLLPAELRDFLWEHRDDVSSIVVHTEEPSIPWELCLLTHKDASGTVEDGYLCELFELTRWRPHLEARDELTMRSIGVIAPEDSGLKSLKDELEMLNGLKSQQRTVTEIPATKEKVLEALSKANHDVIHFIGHGDLQHPDRIASARIVLSGTSHLPAEWLSGSATNFGDSRPLVFLNACRLGTAGTGLVGPAGWARVVLDAGSAAFIGAHWNVLDDSAHKFAAALYQELVNNEPIGKATKTARLAVRAAGDPTWLAYTVFASPGATVTSP